MLAGTLLILIGGIGLYGRTAILDERSFADRAVAAFANDEVQDEVGDRIPKREVEAERALAPRRPTLEEAVHDVVTDWRFGQRFGAGAAAMHRNLFAGRSVDLVIPGGRAALRDAISPDSRARRLLPARGPHLFHLGGGRLETGLVKAAPVTRRLARFAPVALVAGLVLLLAAGWRAPTRRQGARRVAFGVALAGGVAVAATTVARAIVLSTFDTSHGDAVVREIWDAYLGDLRVWGLVAGALGLVVAAACEAGARGAWRRPLARVASPCGAGARLGRAAALLMLAALLLWMPEVPLDLAAVSAAGLLVFTSAAELVRL